MIVLVVVLAVAIVALEWSHLRERRWWAERCLSLLPGGRAALDKPRTPPPPSQEPVMRPTKLSELAD